MVNITVNNIDYRLRLTAKGCIELEKKGINPLTVFAGVSGTNIPSISTILTIFGESIKQLNHGISDADVMDIFDKYIEEGHDIADIIQLIIEVFQDSGLAPKDDTEDEEEKN